MHVEFKADMRVRPRAMALVMASLTLAGALSGCLGKNKEGASGSSQVVAVVNGKEISIHQVQAVLQAQPAIAAQLGEAAVGKVTDSLIEQELAAQAAREAKLDESPRVLQAMEVAKREILARAYQDQLADKANMASEKDIDKYYDEHPELFAQRRVFNLQEAVIMVPPEQVQALREKLEGAHGVAAVNLLLSQSGFKFRTETTVVGAENLPLDILPKLASREPGQSVALDRPDGLMLLTVVQSQEAPVTQAHASKAIQAALMSLKRRALIQEGMKSLRDKAQIVRKNASAALPASASAPASASSAP
jgi:EpsD family peptidyl-prolyl cis-trans isomerase